MAKDLKDGGWKPSQLEVLNVPMALVLRNTQLFKSDSQNIAWCSGMFDYSSGHFVDLRDGKSGEFDFAQEYVYVDSADIDDSSTYFTATVYNLEVEDFHTYYVGTQGIWVHDFNARSSEQVDSIHGSTSSPRTESITIFRPEQSRRA